MSLILFWLLVAHALCDYPLQGDFLARGKNRHAWPSVLDGVAVWPHALTAHCSASTPIRFCTSSAS